MDEEHGRWPRRSGRVKFLRSFQYGNRSGVLWLPPDVGVPMSTRRPILMILILVGCVSVLACATVRKDRKIEFVYLALGASDATGVGALPLTEGYVFLIKRELDKRVPGVALVNRAVSLIKRATGRSHGVIPEGASES